MCLHTTEMLARDLCRFLQPNRSLVVVDSLLPRPVAFHPYLHASEYHLFATSEIDSQLNYIPVVDRERF